MATDGSNLDLDPDDPGPKDACGVFGVWGAAREEVAKLTYYGLYALQHRGQESAGIAVSNGRQIMVFKDMGLVSQVFDEPTLESLQGHLAIGHCRYSTTGVHLAERPADLPRRRPAARRAWPTTATSPTPRAELIEQGGRSGSASTVAGRRARRSDAPTISTTRTPGS